MAHSEKVCFQFSQIIPSWISVGIWGRRLDNVVGDDLIVARAAPVRGSMVDGRWSMVDGREYVVAGRRTPPACDEGGFSHSFSVRQRRNHPIRIAVEYLGVVYRDDVLCRGQDALIAR